MEQISLKVPSTTTAILDELQKYYGIRTRAALFKRLVAIGRLAQNYADKEKCLHIKKPGAKKKDEMMIIALVK